MADPRLFALAVQDVEVTGDLSIAKVRVRLMFGGEEDAARREAMQALGRIAPYLRSSLSPEQEARLQAALSGSNVSMPGATSTTPEATSPAPSDTSATPSTAPGKGAAS